MAGQLLTRPGQKPNIHFLTKIPCPVLKILLEPFSVNAIPQRREPEQLVRVLCDGVLGRPRFSCRVMAVDDLENIGNQRIYRNRASLEFDSQWPLPPPRASSSKLCPSRLGKSSKLLVLRDGRPSHIMKDARREGHFPRPGSLSRSSRAY